MSRPTPPPRFGGFCWGAVLLAVLAGGLPAAGRRTWIGEDNSNWTEGGR